MAPFCGIMALPSHNQVQEAHMVETRKEQEQLI